MLKQDDIIRLLPGISSYHGDGTGDNDEVDSPEVKPGAPQPASRIPILWSLPELGEAVSSHEVEFQKCQEGSILICC